MTQYNWKNYVNNYFELLDVSSSQVNIHELVFENLPNEIKALIKPFCLSYQTLQIPNFNKALLDELLQLNNLEISIDEFITIGCSLQYQYDIALEMNENDILLNDFDLEKVDYKFLLNVLENFLFDENNKNLHSILFKFNQSETIKISNFFIIRDIFEAICIGYGINKSNFQERKAEILALTNQVILSKLGEKVKVDYAQTLYSLLESNFSKDSDIFRFIGVFFHIFQVPTNNNQTTELLYSDIKTTLKSIDIKNLRHYINGRSKFLHD